MVLVDIQYRLCGKRGVFVQYAFFGYIHVVLSETFVLLLIKSSNVKLSLFNKQRNASDLFSSAQRIMTLTEVMVL